MTPKHDTLVPASTPLVVFGHEFDVLAISCKQAREDVRKLENDLVRAKELAKKAEDACNTFVSKAMYG